MSPLSDQLQFKIKYDFLLLLVALCLLVFVPSFVPSGIAKTGIIYTTLLLAIIASIISTATSKQHFYIGISLAIFALVSNIIPGSNENIVIFLARMIGLISFFSYTALTLLYRIAYAKKVSLNIIYGSIAGYLLMGILGGFWCRLIEHLSPGSFSLPAGLEAQLDTLTYFSFVTMSSLGYGDITPTTAAGRSTAIFIGITGQMYVTINIALLVGSYSRRTNEAKES